MSARPYNNLESSLISDVLSTENTASETVGLTPTDLAYVAGYMDGEGCFRANKGNIEVQIKNTYPNVLYDIQRMFGGSVREERRSLPNAKHRTAFSFGIYGESAREMVRSLLPYLREKKSQAELTLELINHPKNSSKKDFLIRRLKALKRVDHGE